MDKKTLQQTSCLFKSITKSTQSFSKIETNSDEPPRKLSLEEFALLLQLNSVSDIKLEGIDGDNFDFTNFRRVYISLSRNREIKRLLEETRTK